MLANSLRRWPNINLTLAERPGLGVYIYRPRYSVNTKHLYNICTMSVQRLRRWTDIVQMLYKCFVCTDLVTRLVYPCDYCRRLLSLAGFVFPSPPDPSLSIIYHQERSINLKGLIKSGVRTASTCDLILMKCPAPCINQLDGIRPASYPGCLWTDTVRAAHFQGS